ncbi:MAG: hypothetical protein AAGL49_05700 [Pseudomonadota bacterium]
MDDSFLKSIAALASVFLLLCLSSCATAPLGSDRGANVTVIHLSPDGSGKRTGKTQDDAVPLADLQRLIDGARGATTFRFADGRYKLEKPIVVRSRAPSHRLAFEGAGDAVQLEGGYRFRPAERGFAAFRLRTGQVEFRRLRFRHVGACIYVVRNARAHDVAIQGVTAENVRNCVVADAREGQSIRNWTISDLTVRGHDKVAIRIGGPTTRAVRIARIAIDGAQDYPQIACHKVGVEILHGASDIEISDGLIENTIGACERYAQGDGVMIDDRRSAPSNIRIENLTVRNSRDGNLDLKGVDVSLHRVVSLPGPQTRYGFRFWRYAYLCDECVTGAPGKAHVFLRNAQVTFADARFDGDASVPRCLKEDASSGGAPSRAVSAPSGADLC